MKYKCVTCFKHVCNRPKGSLNIFEDKVGYEEDPPKRVSRCYGCQNVSIESSREYQKKGA